ncbi:hypothetical protein ACKI16_40780, partial [Streptomyces scabiei]
ARPAGTVRNPLPLTPLTCHPTPDAPRNPPPAPTAYPLRPPCPPVRKPLFESDISPLPPTRAP